MYTVQVEMLLLYVNFALSDIDQDIIVVCACMCVFSDRSNSEHNHHSEPWYNCIMLYVLSSGGERT